MRSSIILFSHIMKISIDERYTKYPGTFLLKKNLSYIERNLFPVQLYQKASFLLRGHDRDHHLVGFFSLCGFIPCREQSA